MTNESEVRSIIEKGKTRWLEKNEVLMILNNYNYLTIKIEPVNKPISGTIVLFDRKMLRNFRKDGHKWRMINDIKKVYEGYSCIKVGDENIKVSHAHGEENPKLVRRCYWILDKDRDNIVLVHYREYEEGSDSEAEKIHEKTFHDLNTKAWDELLDQDDLNNFDEEKEKDSCLLQQQNPSDNMLEDYFPDPNNFGVPQQINFCHTNLQDLQSPDSFDASLDEFLSNSAINHLQSTEEIKAAGELQKTGVDTSRDDDSEKDEATTSH